MNLNASLVAGSISSPAQKPAGLQKSQRQRPHPDGPGATAGVTESRENAQKRVSAMRGATTGSKIDFFF